MIDCPCLECPEWVKCFSGERDACSKFIRWTNRIITKRNKKLEAKKQK